MRLDKEKQAVLEPKRIEFAIKELREYGIVAELVSDREVQFKYNNEVVRFFPYSGWYSGKSIKDGRGLHNLLKQII